MHPTTTLLATAQQEWPLLSRLSLIGCTTPPAWAIATANRLATQLSAAERARCQAQYPHVIAQLSGLRRQWRGTLILAVLLAMAVIARAFEVPLDMHRMVIFAVTLYAILFPALLIQIGMTYDSIAASAMLQALRSAEGPHRLEQRVSTAALPAEVFHITPSPGTSSSVEYVEHDREQID